LGRDRDKAPSATGGQPTGAIQQQLTRQKPQQGRKNNMGKTLMERLFRSWGPQPAEDEDDWTADRHGVDDGPSTDPHEELAPPPSVRRGLGTHLFRAEPKKLDDAEAIADRMRQGHPVVVSLEQADGAEAQRIRDFLSGVSYALGGYIRKVAARVYACAPNSMPIEPISGGSEGHGVGHRLAGAASVEELGRSHVWPE
jgi:cell division inhibitor SepF